MTDLIDPWEPGDPIDWPAEMQRLRDENARLRSLSLSAAPECRAGEREVLCACTDSCAKDDLLVRAVPLLEAVAQGRSCTMAAGDLLRDFRAALSASPPRPTNEQELLIEDGHGQALGRQIERQRQIDIAASPPRSAEGWQPIETALANWFRDIHMSEVVTRELDGAKIATPLPSEDDDSISVNLTTLARALAAAPAPPLVAEPGE